MRYARLLMILSIFSFALCVSFTTASGSETVTWSTATSMAYERFNHKSVLLPDGRVLVVGGHFKISSPAEIYDPKSGSWSIAGWPHGWWGEDTRVTLLRNGKVLVVGGNPPELYDPATNNWSMAGTMNSLRQYGATAALLSNGMVLVAGGDTGAATGGPASSAELYDPDTNSWVLAASMGSQRYGAASALLPNGKVLVVGGETADAELYDPNTNKWSAAGWLDSIRYGHTLTLLADGKVLLAGGYLAGTTSIYDPATGTWSNFSVMPNRVYNHTATLLPDGKVVVAGGRTDNYVPQSAVWLYDPVTNTWSLDSSMSTGRYSHSAVLMQDGKLLVAGGRIDADPFQYGVATAEIRSVMQLGTSVHLFTPKPATYSGIGTGPSEAVSFGRQKIVLRCDSPVSAVLASTADGTGSLVVDNFMTVNGINVCTGGIYSQDSENCYSRYSEYSGTYDGVKPLDISDKIPTGRSVVQFSLMDFGGFLGNSDIWLVTNCVLDEKVDVCHKPRTAAQNTLSLPQSAVPDHLGHGDDLGPCQK